MLFGGVVVRRVVAAGVMKALQLDSSISASTGVNIEDILTGVIEDWTCVRKPARVRRRTRPFVLVLLCSAVLSWATPRPGAGHTYPRTPIHEQVLSCGAPNEPPLMMTPLTA